MVVCIKKENIKHNIMIESCGGPWLRQGGY